MRKTLFRLLFGMIACCFLLTACADSTSAALGQDDPLAIGNEVRVEASEDTSEISEVVSAIGEVSEIAATAEAVPQEEDSGSAAEGETSDLAEEETNPYTSEYCQEHYPLAMALLSDIGWDLRAAYDWCVQMAYYNGSPIDAELGTQWYADFGFENSCGNCYTYAATFTEMARCLGYPAVQINGHIDGYEEFHHSWVEIEIDGVIYITDPEYEWERGRDGFMHTYEDGLMWAFSEQDRDPMRDESTPESLERLLDRGWPITGPYDDYIVFQTYDPESDEEDPNAGCIGDDTPLE